MSGKPFSFDAVSKYSDAVFQSSDDVNPQQQIEPSVSSHIHINSATPISKKQLGSKLQYITNCSNRLTIPYRSFDPGINSYNRINDSTYGSENNVIGGYGANTYYLKRVKKLICYFQRLNTNLAL